MEIDRIMLVILLIILLVNIGVSIAVLSKTRLHSKDNYEDENEWK